VFASEGVMPCRSEEFNLSAVSLGVRKEKSAVSCRQPPGARGRGDRDRDGGEIIFGFEGLEDLGGAGEIS